MIKFLKQNNREHFIEDYWKNETKRILGELP